MLLSNEDQTALLVRTPFNRETKRELIRPWVQYAVTAARMQFSGRDAIVPSFNIGMIDVTPSSGPLRA